ncbi:DUF1178 family protein [Breoghania sp. L-A4]|uniref:DUF1178 family protein n=1 Tax=Breoghania sp. L-A4 TaxID=2304600 RepID=UPI000E35EDCD|nr:DUF1178 family protein [Breoghania sp. L-A4]AXS42027.1 DUF1178 family protein [Breoghania sp. L-A4]
MIHFALVCDGGHAFDAWFRNAGDFDAQARAGHLVCPVCASADVRKALMAPNVSTARKKAAAQQEAGGVRASGTAGIDEAEADTPPQVPVPSPAASLAAADPRRSEVAAMMRALRDTVIRNTENVGTGFAEEARKMHYGEAEKRGIHGETSAREAHELREEGIDILPLPTLPEDNN